jgi:hypothetical protein
MFFSKIDLFIIINCVKITLLIKKPLFNQKNRWLKKIEKPLFFNRLGIKKMLFL